MAIYLDSALISEAEKVAKWGWVSGVTTNPILLGKSDQSPQLTLEKLKELFSGEIYYQLTRTEVDEMIKEGYQAVEILGNQTVLKIPATSIGFQVLSRLSQEIVCSITGIYHPIQAVIAAEGGAKYAIAYVNRATRLLGDGYQLVREMATVLKGSSTQILAASIKSREEAFKTLLAGADHLTLPLTILESIMIDPLSEETVIEFHQNGCGLS